MTEGAVLISVMLTLFQLSSCSIATSTKVSEPETQVSEMPVDIEEVQSFTRIILPTGLTQLAQVGQVRSPIRQRRQQ